MRVFWPFIIRFFIGLGVLHLSCVPIEIYDIGQFVETNSSDSGSDIDPVSGTIDISFGNNGVVWFSDLLTPDGDTAVGNLVIDGNGNIILSGSAVDDTALKRLFIARLLADGTHDVSFGDNGMVFHPDVIVPKRPPKISLDSSENYMITTNVSESAESEDVYAGLVKYLPGSGWDLSFGTDGVALCTVISVLFWHTVIDSEDRVLITGAVYSGVANEYDYAITRFLADGTMDPTFDVDGVASFHVANDFWLWAEIDNTGRILGAGEGRLFRYTDAGQLDVSFGEAGIVNLDGAEFTRPVLILDGGHMVVAGNPQDDQNVSLWRVDENGSPVTSFGANGRTEIGVIDNECVGCRLMDAGANEILLFAGSPADQDADGYMVKISDDGVVLPEFGNNGKVSLGAILGEGEYHIKGIRRDSNNRILVAGMRSNGVRWEVFIARFFL